MTQRVMLVDNEELGIDTEMQVGNGPKRDLPPRWPPERLKCPPAGLAAPQDQRPPWPGVHICDLHLELRPV